MKLPTIPAPSQFIVVGIAAAALFIWWRSRQDINEDKKPDGVFGGLGQSIGRVPFDFIGGVGSGVVDGARDLLFDMPACAKAHREGSLWGKLTNCPPTRLLDNDPWFF